MINTPSLLLSEKHGIILSIQVLLIDPAANVYVR